MLPRHGHVAHSACRSIAFAQLSSSSSFFSHPHLTNPQEDEGDKNIYQDEHDGESGSDYDLMITTTCILPRASAPCNSLFPHVCPLGVLDMIMCAHTWQRSASSDIICSFSMTRMFITDHTNTSRYKMIIHADLVQGLALDDHCRSSSPAADTE